MKFRRSCRQSMSRFRKAPPTSPWPGSPRIRARCSLASCSPPRRHQGRRRALMRRCRGARRRGDRWRRRGTAAAKPCRCFRVDDPRRRWRACRRAFLRPPARHHGRRHRHRRQDLGRLLPRQIWEADGQAAASIGTTGVTAPGRNEYGSLTTPDPVALHRLLDRTRGRGRHPCVDGSLQPRPRPAPARRRAACRRARSPISAATTWTITRRSRTTSHAKMRLFDTLLPKGAPAVIFADDPWSEPAIEAAAEAGREVLTVGRNGDFLALKRVEHERYQAARRGPARRRDPSRCDLPLAGDFQISNALVAAGLAIATGSAGRQGACGARAPQGRAGPARTGRHRRRTARPSMSTMRTSPMRWRTC